MDHEQNLSWLAREYDESCAVAEKARIKLARAIRGAAEDGVRQVDVVHATGYTREQVRRIVNSEDPRFAHSRRQPPWQEADDDEHG